MLFFLNAFLFQWLFVRLAAWRENIDGKCVTKYYTFMAFVVPLTGWWSDYIFIGKSKTFFKIR